MGKFGVHAGRPSRCRSLVGLVGALAMVASMSVASAEAAVVKSSPTAAVAPHSVATAVRAAPIRMSPSVAFPFQRVTVSGKLVNRKSRTLWMQRKVGTRWVNNGFKTRTTRTGSYAFQLYGSSFSVNPYTITVRMMAPRLVVRGRVQGRYVTGSRTLTVIPRT